MIIYFHIEEVGRDSVVGSALKKAIKEQGGRIVYGNRFISSFLLKKFNCFDAVIFPSLVVFKNVFDDPLKIPENVFILPTEAVGQGTKNLKRINAKYVGNNPSECEAWHKKIAGFMLWGYRQRNFFELHFKKYLPKVRVVGHPRYSKYLLSVDETDEKSSKKVIGIVSRFNLINSFNTNNCNFENIINGTNHVEKKIPTYENSPDKNIEDLFYNEVADFRLVVEIINKIDRNKFRTLLRPHPRENRLNWYKIEQLLNVEISTWDEPFTNWLRKVDIVVLPPSTSLYEIAFLNKSAIVIDQINDKRKNHILTESDDNNEILSAFPRPQSIVELIELLEHGKCQTNYQIVKPILSEQTAYEIAKDSSENIIKFISSVIGVEHQFSILRKTKLNLFMGLSLVLSNLRKLKFFMRQEQEQGSTFHLSWRRIIWINQLANKNKYSDTF